MPSRSFWANAIQTVIEHAIARKIFDGGNPATLSQVTHLLGRQTDSVENFKALPYRQMYTFMQAVRAHPGVAAQALEFLVLTATRSGRPCGLPGRRSIGKRRSGTSPARVERAARVRNSP